MNPGDMFNLQYLYSLKREERVKENELFIRYFPEAMEQLYKDGYVRFRKNCRVKDKNGQCVPTIVLTPRGKNILRSEINRLNLLGYKAYIEVHTQFGRNSNR